METDITKLMHDKYFIVYRIDWSSDNGRSLGRARGLMDSFNANGLQIMGFHTKRRMKDFIAENCDAFLEYNLLKPIS